MITAGRIRLSRGEVVLLVLLAVWAVAPFVYLVAIAHGDSFDGSAAIFGATDYLQYLSWIRESGTRGLVSNRFDTIGSRHVYFHPLFFVSGILWRAGLSLPLADRVFEPVAVVAMFAGAVAYARRMLPAGWRRIAAVILALFSLSPITPILDWSQAFDSVTRFQFLIISLETFQAGALWGALPTAIAFGLMPLTFLAAERALKQSGGVSRPRMVWLGSLCGGLVAWFHPWQGITIILALAGLVVWDRLRRRNLVLAPIVVVTALPVAYYLALPHLSAAWAIAAAPNNYPHVGIWLLALAPLALLAVLGLPAPGPDPGERLLRLWPLMAVVLYFALRSSFFYHALETVTVPLAILAIRGIDRLGAGRLVIWATVALLTVPGTLYFAQYLGRTLQNRTEFYVTADEARAMEYLSESSRSGAVLAPTYLGKDVPARTGRSTWVGHPTWTPDYARRSEAAQNLFAGTLAPTKARQLVLDSHAAFLLSGCSDPNRVADELDSLLSAKLVFGCATIYEVRPP